jgi:hypothetical protein
MSPPSSGRRRPSWFSGNDSSSPRRLPRRSCPRPSTKNLKLKQIDPNETILLEFPLYRLQRRIDIIVLATSVIVIEAKVGEHRFLSSDERQVEEYCLDLRDFHEGSRGQTLFPVLWATQAPTQESRNALSTDPVALVSHVGATGLARLIGALSDPTRPAIDAAEWDESGYHPVPSVIQAATSIFVGHDVRQMAQADASNLREAATRVVDLIAWARRDGKRALIFLTGVPGSGKTLAGLQAVQRCDRDWGRTARRYRLSLRQYSPRNRASRSLGP